MEQYVLREYTKLNECISEKQSDNAENMFKLFELETTRLKYGLLDSETTELKQGNLAKDIIRVELHRIKGEYDHTLKVSHKPKTVEQIKEIGYDLSNISVGEDNFYVQSMGVNYNDELSLFVAQIDGADVYTKLFTLEELANRTDVAFYQLREV